MTIDDVFSTFPVLHTERLTLRKFTPADADALYTHFSNPKVMHYLDFDALTTREQSAELVDFFIRRYDEDKFSIRWVVEQRDQPGLIGTGGFNYFDRDSHWSEIGYDLAPSHWGKGLMSEAVRAMLDYGFTTAGLHRIEANVTTGNDASVRLLERLGFQREGVLRERLYTQGRYQDLIYYGLLRSEWTR